MDKLVAVKVVKQECTQHMHGPKREEYRQKAQMLEEMRSEYILKFYGACFDHKQVR